MKTLVRYLLTHSMDIYLVIFTVDAIRQLSVESVETDLSTHKNENNVMHECTVTIGMELQERNVHHNKNVLMQDSVNVEHVLLILLIDFVLIHVNSLRVEMVSSTLSMHDVWILTLVQTLQIREILDRMRPVRQALIVIRPSIVGQSKNDEADEQWRESV